MNTKTANWLRVLLYAACGALCALPSVISSLWIVSWVAFVPVLLCEYKRKPTEKRPLFHAWRRGLTFFYFYGLVTFYWFIELYPLDFAGLSRPAALAVVIVAWFGLPLLQAVFAAFMFLPFTIMSRGKHAAALFPFTAASLWVFFEWLQTQTWAGVPWGKLAIGQTGRLQNIQSASLLGSYLVSFIMIFTSALIVLAIIEFVDKKKLARAACYLCAAVLVFEANSIFGMITINYKNNTDRGEPVKIAAIQANISSDDKWSEDEDYTLRKYRELTLAAAQDGAQLVIWPETALPYEINLNARVSEYLESLSREAGVPIMAGALIYEDSKDLYNVICYVTPDGGIKNDYYAKRRLVPFGEFVPMRSLIMTIIPPLANLSALSEDIIAGTETKVFDTNLGKIGSLICFDSIYEQLATDSVRDGAELLAISTNDSWFHDSSAVYQHNAHAKLRSVENGRFTVRSANTGISSVITDTGEVKELLPPLVEGYIVQDVYMLHANTIYNTVGNLIVLLAFIFIIIRIFIYIKYGHNYK